MDWYTGDVGLYYELAGRFQADAMLSGSQTVITAFAGHELPETEEALTQPPARDPADTRPWLVIVDSRGRVGPLAQLRRQPYWRDVIMLCSRATPQARLRELEQQQVEHIIAGDDRVDLAAALAEVRERYGINEVRVDSGGILNGVLLRAGLVNELSLIINPCLVGGTTPASFFTAPDLTSADGVIRSG
jgi:2,5-diamino-6-(ribosylamino)-4(3H)-pyrimidinone 5'-phosphate reductase